MIKIGDLVISVADYTLPNSGTLIFTNGSKFIVNDLRTATCKCQGNNKWTYVWFGHYHPTLPVVNFVCNKCNSINVSDKKIWITKSQYTKLDPNKEFTTRYSLQINLMRLLIDKQITPEAYKRLIVMTEGDDEMLELGNQILTKIGTNEI